MAERTLQSAPAGTDKGVSTTLARDLLTKKELGEVTGKSNLQGAIIVGFDWMMVFGLFVLAAQIPNPLIYLLVIILLGGRQLALGIIVHEAGHRTLFKSQAINEFCGTWLSGYWVFSDKDVYMQGHLKHHQDCGTRQDPDLKNYDAYPVSHESFSRKVLRDLTGQIGWRRVKSIGRAIRGINTLPPGPRKTLTGSIAVNLAMLATLWASGHPWLYALWVIAFMTSHMLVTRIRQIAEHAAVQDHFSPDARLNTRTIYINRLERLLVSPHQLNYHLEHHLMPSVPIYRLQKLHKILLARGHYEGMTFPRGYLNLLRQVTLAS